MIPRPVLLALALLATAALPTQAACINISKKDGLLFSGALRHKIFPGPPGYEDVRKGDMPEPTYILELDAEECAQGDEMIEDGTKFRTVHLSIAEDDKRVGADLRRLIGRKVWVRGDSAYGAHTGHHHAPIVMDVVSVEVNRDMSWSYGAPQTTVEAFYAALGAGNGDEAARLVVPEKRAKGPFSAAEITRFYGSLAEPLRTFEVALVAPGQYRVRYAYTQMGKARCGGEALVTTRRVGELNLIAGAKALNGC